MRVLRCTRGVHYAGCERHKPPLMSHLSRNYLSRACLDKPSFPISYTETEHKRAVLPAGGAGVRDWATYGTPNRMAKGSGELPANATGEALLSCPQMVGSFSPATSSGKYVQPQVSGNGFVVHFVWYTNDHFTTTGSGQTYQRRESSSTTRFRIGCQGRSGVVLLG